MIEFIKQNFMHIAPILALGGVAVLIIFDRAMRLIWVYPMQSPKVFFAKIKELIMADRVSDAIALCERYPHKPIAQVVREGLQRGHQPETLVEDKLQIVVAELQAEIAKRTPFLSSIANVSTLLGLFGTIIGLIQSFEAVGSASAQQKAALLAAGISSAMNATLMGLGVGISCMIAFSFLMNKTNQLVGEVETAALNTMDMLKQRNYSCEVETAAPKKTKA